MNFLLNLFKSFLALFKKDTTKLTYRHQKYNEAKSRIIHLCSIHYLVEKELEKEQSFIVDRETKYDENIITRMFDKGLLKSYKVIGNTFELELGDKFYKSYRSKINKLKK